MHATISAPTTTPTESPRAWAIVAASVVVMTLGMGGALYLFGVLFPALVAAFGWSRAELAGANAVAMLVMGLLGPFTGRAVERYGPRRLMAAGAICCGLGFGGQGLVGLVDAVDRVVSPFGQIYACYALFGLGLSGVGFVPVNTVVAAWFSAHRGLALGLVSAGTGLGGLLAVPAGWLIDHFGWRVACATVGAVMTAIMLPLVATVMRPAPRAADAAAAPAGAARVAAPSPEIVPPTRALASWAFWALGLAFAIYTVVVTVVRVFGIALLEESGFAAVDARLVMTGLAFSGIGGKVLFGWLADRFAPRAVTAIAFGLQALGTLVLLEPGMSGFTPIFVFVFGLPMGGLATLQPVIVAASFGRAAFGTVYGLLILLLTAGASGGPVIAGAIYDVGGGYRPTLVACAGGCMLGVLLVLLAPGRRVSVTGRPSGPGK